MDAMDTNVKMTSTTTAVTAAEPICAQDTSVKVVETVQNRVETKKTVVQKTSNTNATQVNRYDTEGNLKSSEIDSSSWEDRDTQNYEWSNKDEPPPEALQPPPSDERFEQFFADGNQQQQQQLQGGETAVVLKTSQHRDVPAVTWTGQSSSQLVDDASGQEHKSATKMEGSQWSRSGEAVWISSSTTPTSRPPVAVTSTPSENGTMQTSAVNLSTEERRRRRCAENRTRRAAATVAAAPPNRCRPTSSAIQ